MKKKLIYGIVLLLVILGGARGIYSFFVKSDAVQYQFGKVSRTNIENTISASGTLSPVTTVEVGTQVSGTIDAIYVDFNDKVKKGQLLAVLDTTVLKVTLIDAEAGVEKAEAGLEQAKSDFNRNKKLYEKELISEADYLPYQISVKTAEASLKSARAALQRTRQNFEYAFITSPINGIVMAKNVEAGQTVAASLSTPTLFHIAEDLSHMEILVDVDESDIGEIKLGQAVRFEVQAYSDKTFNGTVTQIRLEPETVSNVVTYTVVVDAANNENLLLPGMTATVDFITQSREDALVVPNSALRYQPSEEEMAQAFEKRQAARAAMPVDSTQARPPLGPTGDRPTGERPQDAGQVWYLGDDGSLAMAMVRTGITDGTNTEIVLSRDLKEGMEVITSEGSTKTTTSSSTSQSSNQRFGPPPGF
ncbi:MAG: efflux RND transporter periplasmic adaptor subunit [Candidatus Zixiibacteriota bacterium]